MKTLSILLLLLLWPYYSNSQTATEIIKKSDELMQGNSSYSEMTMTIVRPTYQRNISFKSWSKGRDYGMVLITAPAKEKGQSFLKRKNEMWNWVPSISKMIKLPPSMLSQGWMGSDVSNNELLNESSIVNDYDHILLGKENFGGYICWKIKLVPKPGTPVVWGYIIKWISQDGYFQLKSEYYDEENQKVKTEIATDIKTMDNRLIPTRFEVIPADNPKQKTILTIVTMDFDIPIKDDFFSQQQMKILK